MAARIAEVGRVTVSDVGWGSTAASTALLQYEIDTHLYHLAQQYGEASAVMAYQGCAEAVHALAARAAELGDIAFRRQQSLYFASEAGHLSSLRDEYAIRKRWGFDVQWCSPAQLQEAYGFNAPGGILSHLAATVDPYRMAYQLLDEVVARGGHVYDRTAVESLEADGATMGVRLRNGALVRCQQVIMAAGYESQTWLPEPVASNRSSYAFVTDPLPGGIR